VSEVRELPLVEAIREAYQQEMERDESVFMVGQDIAGGIFPHTKGLVEQFGTDRIVDTPLAEVGMYGTAFGAAMEGFKPIVDFMFAGFFLNAAAPILAQTAQFRFIHGSQMSLPMVITGACGSGMRLGNEHAMLVHNMIAQVPGIKVCMPSTPYDAKGLMISAIRDPNPVAFIWHLGTMMDRGPVPEEAYEVPLGVAEVKREGSDITLVANGFQYKNAVEVADKLAGDISVEIIDPRSISPLDIDTILKSVDKTGRLVIVDESWDSRSTASQIAAQVVDEGFDMLDAPIKRVCIPDIPLPGGHMEPYVAPNPDAIEAAVRDVCQ